MCYDCENIVPADQNMVQVNLGGRNGYVCVPCADERMIEEAFAGFFDEEECT